MPRHETLVPTTDANLRKKQLDKLKELNRLAKVRENLDRMTLLSNTSGQNNDNEPEEPHSSGHDQRTPEPVVEPNSSGHDQRTPEPVVEPNSETMPNIEPVVTPSPSPVRERASTPKSSEANDTPDRSNTNNQGLRTAKRDLKIDLREAAAGAPKVY